MPEIAATTGTDLAATVAVLVRLVRPHLVTLADLPLGSLDAGDEQ